MQAVQMKKSQLLETVKANRQKHEETYKLALEGFWLELQEKINQLKSEADQRKDKTYYVSLAKPECHLDEYDRAIQMLEFEVRDIVELDNDTFRELVQDNWHWQKAFTAVTKSYVDSALRSR